MPKYLIKARYTQSGIGGVLKNGGTARLEAVTKAAEAVGGKIESFHFAFGDVDAYVICEFPDNATAARLAMTVGASGGATAETVALLTPQEVDAASEGEAVPYRSPNS